MINRMLPASASSLLAMAIVVAFHATATFADDAPAVRLEPDALPATRPEALSLWKDPVFQRRFVESYLAETEIEPRLTEPERERMQEILALLGSDDMDGAAKLLEQEIARDPAASAVLDFTLANIRFQREDLPRAATSYSAAVQKFPKFRRAWKNLALVHVRLGEFDKAQPALIRVIELGGGDATTYGMLGFAHASAENHLAAETAYRNAILLDPKTSDWQMGLARSLFRQQRYAEAATLCEGLSEKDPDRADLWLLQANARIGMNQPLEAARIYEILDSMGKATPESLFMLCDIYINEDLASPAAKACVRALEMKPAEGAARALRAARALVARDATAETRDLVEAIRRVAGDSLDAEQKKELLRLRARLAVAEGAGDEEARVLEEIVALDPLDGEALILLGQHAQRNGDREKAIFQFERAAALEKHEADAKLRHAQLLVGEGKYEEALPLLRRAQTLQPRDSVQEFLEQVERVARAR